MSAVSASPTASGLITDPVRALQHALYRRAKADPGRRFHTLGDEVYRRDVLERAWVNVRRNGGAAGIDRTTIADEDRASVTLRSPIGARALEAVREGRLALLSRSACGVTDPVDRTRKPM